MSHLKVAWLLVEQLHLVDPLVFGLLVADVFADHLLVASDRLNEVPAGPEVLAHVVAPNAHVRSCDVDRASP